MRERRAKRRMNFSRFERVRSLGGGVLAGPNVLIAERPDGTIVEEDCPVERMLEAMPGDQMRPTLAPRGIERQRRVELQHGITQR
jgi:hypothetical protein